jgi:F0F1-type ATP synthase assembly protein I
MWASRITTLGFEFALPPVAGYYLDERFRSGPWGVLIGSALGFALGIVHILRIAREGTKT